VGRLSCGAEDAEDAWYMNSGGALDGNGQQFDDEAGIIYEGQIVVFARFHNSNRPKTILALLTT
jgi:hypothetical protein